MFGVCPNTAMFDMGPENALLEEAKTVSRSHHPVDLLETWPGKPDHPDYEEVVLSCPETSEIDGLKR